MSKTKLQESYAHAFREGLPSGSQREAILIREGWGSSGYYSAEVLGRDMPKIFPPGSHMYMNHPTLNEEWERPERDLRDLVGVTAEAPRMAGIESVSAVEVYPHWEPFIEAVAKDTGLSVRAFGIAEAGAAGGKDGDIVKAMTEGVSIDYVTKPGAGGRVKDLMESARAGAPSPEDRAIEAYNKIMESAGKPKISKELLLEVLKTDNLELFEEAERIGDMPEWNWSSELREAEIEFNRFLERDVPDAERISLAKKGQAIPIKDSNGNITGGRFPMANCEDVKAAATSVGRTGIGDIHAFIKKVAGKLSCPIPFTEAALPPKPKGVNMDELAELKESFNQFKSDTETRLKEAEDGKKEAEARADRAEEVVIRESASRIVAQVLNENEALPAKAKARIAESTLSVELPVLKDGKLDESVLQERARAKITEEIEYLQGLTGAGKPRGVGALAESGFGGGNEPSEEDTKALVEVFKKQGMNDEQAKRAAEGR